MYLSRIPLLTKMDTNELPCVAEIQLLGRGCYGLYVNIARHPIVCILEVPILPTYIEFVASNLLGS